MLLLITCTEARLFCEKTKMPVEVGTWHSHLKHMDSAVVENRPVSINEGQVYVYENHFPGHSIEYIHVDNVAIKSCGASANIKKGGIGNSFVLIVLHAATNEEIRSVIDIWGTKLPKKPKTPSKDASVENVKYLHLFKELRTVNHNTNT